MLRKPNVGIFIEAGPGIRENLIRELSGQKEYLLYFSAAEKKQCPDPDAFTGGRGSGPVDQIEPVLGISRPTLRKTLNKVAAWLHGYGLELIHKPRASFLVSGSERCWREAMTGNFPGEFWRSPPAVALQGSRRQAGCTRRAGIELAHHNANRNHAIPRFAFCVPANK